MRGKALVYAVIPMLILVGWFLPRGLSDEATTLVNITFMVAMPLSSILSVRSLYLAFKPHYDLTPTIGSRTINVLAKVVSALFGSIVLPFVFFVTTIAIVAAIDRAFL